MLHVLLSFLSVAVSNLPSEGEAALHFSLPLGFTLGFFILVGELQLDQMSFDPLPSLPRNPLLELCPESPMDARVSHAQQAYYSISKVCSTLYLSRKWCTNKLEPANRHTGQPMHPRCQLAQYLLTTQNSDTSREVGSWWFKYHI